MRKSTIAFTVLLALIFYDISYSQFRSAFYFLRTPRSVRAFGLGQQGVASLSSSGAMQYNPAGLVNSDSVSFSYFNYPNMYPEQWRTFSCNYSMRLGKYGSFGLEYSDMDLGDKYAYSSSKLNPYEKTFAVAYANRINKELSAGAEIRLAWEKYYNDDNTYFSPLISAGIMYQPEILKNRLNLGFSLTDFGSAVNIDRITWWDNNVILMHPKLTYTVPANFNLGVSTLPVTNTFFDLDFEASMSKPLEKGGGFTNSPAQSSYESLFNSWGNFPRDVSSSLGLGYLFHPIYLGNDISLIQEMYLGYNTVGPKSRAENMFYHGFKVGLDVKGITTATIGYSGMWHNNKSIYYYYYYYKMPCENFEFTLSSDLSLFGKHNRNISQNSPFNIILSTGYSFGNVFGKMKEQRLYMYSIKHDNNSNWQISADFYMNENSAITTSLIYSRLSEKNVLYPDDFIYTNDYLTYDTKVETFSLESGYRYHPVEMFRPLFAQASIGIIRLNPVSEVKDYCTSSKYYYKSYSRLSVGCVVPLWLEKIVLIPKISLRTIFMESYWNTTKLSGLNQFEYGINVGYRF